jgi:hypothetical protein
MSDNESIATVMNAETFANLSKPKSVTAKHFQYMTVAHWLISRMQQAIVFSPEQIAGMEKSMGFDCNAKEISAIYSEFSIVQSDISREVSKRLTETFHKNNKASKRVSKKGAAGVTSEALPQVDGQSVNAKPKRKYMKKPSSVEESSSDVGESASASDTSTVPSHVPIANAKPKRKYAKKGSVTVDVANAPIISEMVSEILTEVVNTVSDPVATDPVSVDVAESIVEVAQPEPIKERVSKKASIHVTESDSESNVAPAHEIKKRVSSKKKVALKQSVVDSTIKTLNAFEDILTNMESDENQCDTAVESDLQVESYN